MLMTKEAIRQNWAAQDPAVCADMIVHQMEQLATERQACEKIAADLHDARAKLAEVEKEVKEWTLLVLDTYIKYSVPVTPFPPPFLFIDKGTTCIDAALPGAEEGSDA